MIACLRTAYAAQGLTLHGGVVVDLHRAGGLGDDDWWLAIYVMLSRARQLTNLILVGFTEQVDELVVHVHTCGASVFLEQMCAGTCAV